MRIKKFLEKTDRPVGRMSDWIGVLSVGLSIIGLISWPTSAIDSISKHGWGAIVLVSILSSCLVLISIASLLFGIRKFKPIQIGQIDSPEGNEIVRRIENNIFELRNLIETQHTIIEKTQNELKSHKTYVQDYLRSYEAMLGGAQEQIKTTREATNSIFSALRVEKIYDRLKIEIDRDIEMLSDPATKRELYPHWSAWTSQWRQLESRLYYLARVVENFADVKEALFEVPHEKFKSQYWSFDSAGMSEDQKHEYKTFRLIAANYKEIRSKIDSAIINSIYKTV